MEEGGHICHGHSDEGCVLILRQVSRDQGLSKLQYSYPRHLFTRHFLKHSGSQLGDLSA